MMTLKSLAGLLITTAALAGPVVAAEGDPVAIRRSDGCYVIESMWNLSVQIVTADQFRSTPLLGVDLLRRPSTMSSLPFRFRQDADPNATMDRTLDRRPNQTAATWTDTDSIKEPSPNAIRVQSSGPILVVDIDGVKVTFIDGGTLSLGSDAKTLAAETDVLIVGPNQRSSVDDAGSSLVSASLIVTQTDDTEAENTTVIRAGGSHQSKRTVRLSDRPLTLPPEIESLMTAKETACTASQRVFAKLSTEQMNFRPSNGSHTPRWNAEHMMGRELLFFSQIFHALQPDIPVVDLNPKQMPPDYVARHADWTGEEEARQMQRVSSFTSRFAYLLKDLPLDEKAPGSNWTLRGLLRQMDRHYGEHTANVEKKFELPDWPK